MMIPGTRRSFLRAALTSGLTAWGASQLGGSRAWAGPEPDAASLSATGDDILFITPKTQDAIDRGLKFLAQRQQDDGAFGTSGYSRNVGVCALAGMAFLSAGSMPGRGPFGGQIDRCLDFLLEHTEESGFITIPDMLTHGPMYGHGFATLFLAECFGMTRRGDLRPKLAKAVELIVQTQNNDGGWRYQPQREDADISVTICQIMALRAARNSGLHVPPETVRRCVDYVKRCQQPDGGFVYMLQTGGTSAFARSAAGVVALQSAGIYEGPEIEKGLAYLMTHLPKGDNYQKDSHYFYGHYYAVQAMWQAGGESWERWFPAIRDGLLHRQQQNGSWLDPICAEYGTAMACIILQMPNNYLPIFQR
ncbi:MAG: prenyltransferase/squalene oxidase repeat-containing protein [Pirellulales bacterium]|nr:prenyltransferase/squalene oxidase repeat-containing protein [Pirellulales bacterium]